MYTEIIYGAVIFANDRENSYSFFIGLVTARIRAPPVDFEIFEILKSIGGKEYEGTTT